MLWAQCFIKGRPLNLGGESSPPKFRGYGACRVLNESRPHLETLKAVLSMRS